jgi:integrase
MRHLPLPPGKTEISGSTRRQYALLMTRVLNLSELAGYIDRTPIPRGWLPATGARKRFPILYPSEDATLLRCPEVPLEWRIFYGFLHREGMRRSEATGLQWRELDLANETIALDENKTNHARWWKLSPGVAAALSAWKTRHSAGPNDRVFVEPSGGQMTHADMAGRIRGHLADAGLDRPDLTTRGPNKGRFGTHCFRRSFATRNLAIGKPDDWVRQRTGHTTDELLRYRQEARGLQELELGDVQPLDVAIPELAGPAPDGGPIGPIAPPLPQAERVTGEFGSKSSDYQSRVGIAA